MTKRSIIDYHKEVLDKISFADRSVFRKELRKAFRALLPEEREELKHWFRSACICKVEHHEGKAITIPVAHTPKGH